MPTPTRKTNTFHSLIYNGLIGFYVGRKIPGIKQLWHGLWRWSSERYNGNVTTNLFEFNLVINNGNPLPVVHRQYPHFNTPIAAAVEAGFKLKGGPVTYVDIGVAFGDTPLLVERLVGDKVKKIVCIDGDEKFFSLLSQNLKSLGKKVQTIQTLLSDKEEQIPMLIWERNSTAHAAGSQMQAALPLDLVCELYSVEPDVIKIDVDGYDGRILAGAEKTLHERTPVVIFEWNPALYIKCGSDLMQPFRVLEACGYKQLVWFQNTGPYSHTTLLNDYEGLARMADFCQANYARDGYHYDVLALPTDDAAFGLEVAMSAGGFRVEV